MQITAHSLISNALAGLTRSASESESEETKTETESTSESGSAFDSLLKGIIGKDLQNTVSEEELFAGLLQERVTTSKGEEVGAKFAELLASLKESMRHADGYVSFEDAAKAALKELRTDGDVSSEEADMYYSEAFSGAQLDGNTSALFDDRGGPGDATIATQVLEQALLASRVLFEKFDSDEQSAEVRSLDEASNVKVVTPVEGAAAPEVEMPEETSTEEGGSESEAVNKVKDKLPDLALALGSRKTDLIGRTEDLALGLLRKRSDKEL